MSSKRPTLRELKHYKKGSGISIAGGRYYKKRRGKGLRLAGSGKRNPWLSHVAKERKKHPGMPYKYVLQAAKKTYRR